MSHFTDVKSISCWNNRNKLFFQAPVKRPKDGAAITIYHLPKPCRPHRRSNLAQFHHSIQTSNSTENRKKKSLTNLLGRVIFSSHAILCTFIVTFIRRNMFYSISSFDNPFMATELPGNHHSFSSFEGSSKKRLFLLTTKTTNIDSMCRMISSNH